MALSNKVATGEFSVCLGGTFDTDEAVGCLNFERNAWLDRSNFSFVISSYVGAHDCVLGTSVIQ